jgi:hypothetical protein
MATKVIDLIVLCAAFAAGTLYVGWWAVPVIALAWGWIVGPMRRPATRAAVAAAIAWMGFLAHDAVRGPAGRLARTLGDVMHLPAIVLVGVTVAFPAILAWSAAALGAETAPASRAGRP